MENEIQVVKIIENINTKYYDEERKNLERRRNNIVSGRPEFDGIYNNISTKIYNNPKERDEQIKSINKQIVSIKEESGILSNLIFELKHALAEIEKIAKERVMLSFFAGCLNFERENSSDTLTNNLKEINNKMWLKDIKELPSVQNINHKIDKLMSKNANLMFHDPNFLKYDHTRFQITLEKYLEGHNYHISNFINSANMEYENYYYNNKNNLGIDISRIQLAQKLVNEDFKDFNTCIESRDILSKYHNLQSMYYSYEKAEKFYECQKINSLIVDFKKVLGLSREIKYLESILSVFSNSNIKDSNMYKEVSKEILKQKEILLKMSNKLDMIYGKEGYNTKFNFNKKIELDRLYNEIKDLEKLIEESKIKGDFKLENELKKIYFSKKQEMYDIIKKHPELNLPEYNINLNPKEEQKVETKPPIINEENPIVNNEPIIPTPEIKKIENLEEKVKQIKNEESNYHDLRVVYYQKYMIEKVKGSDFGKISFSEFLSNFAPELTKFIEFERKREQAAVSVYKEYIIYLSNFENKNSAMSFADFSYRRYNIQNLDIPVQYEEEYKGMRK